MNGSISSIEYLERENSRLKQLNTELTANLDSIKMEKKRLQALLDQESDDRKRLVDKINTFTVIGK